MSTSQTDKLNDQLGKHLPGSIHYNFAFPWDRPSLHFVAGDGHRLTDADGNTYWDFFSKFGAAIFGHGHQAYLTHITEALLDNVTAVDHFGPREVDIVERLVRAVPGAEQVRFSLSGTEAVLNALRVARAYTSKQKVIRFVGHYHGNADPLLGGGMQGGDDPYEIVEVSGDPRGTSGRAPQTFKGSLLLPWNDQEALRTTMERYKDDVAAIIMEPLCINGGGIAASKEYLIFLRDIANKHRTLVIFDEVITGFRLGFGSAQHIIGIRPDIWVFGKAMAGGTIPVACIMSSTQIMQVLTEKKATHGGTFNGYPAGLYAVEATLNILERDAALYEKAIAHSNNLREAILRAAAVYEVDLAVQGHSMALCLHACSKPLTSINQWSQELKAKEAIIREAFKQCNILLAPPCRLYPSLSLNDGTVQACTEKLDTVFGLVRKEYDAHGFKR